MGSAGQTPPTIGLISTWPIYQGTTMDRHAQSLVEGICAAAADHHCRLLIGAGVSAMTDRGGWRTAWPAASTGADFVAVGPWNTDGLIVVSDDLSDAQALYTRELQTSGFPVVFTTPEGPGPRVVVDNKAGIRAAITHLIEHGHRRIAFIAGTEHRGGDSAERLRTFEDTLRETAIEADPRLIAYGDHRVAGGRLAMQRILASGAPFTAVIASNDLSCLGALDVLAEAGLRVPEDVAAIGFDDILDARSHRPSLTTVRHPTYALGYQAVDSVLERIRVPFPGPGRNVDPVVVPTRLIRRESCGCRQLLREPLPASPSEGGDPLADLAHDMAEAAFAEARHQTIDDLEARCRLLVTALLSSVERADERPLDREIVRLLADTEAHGEDTHVWQAAISAVYAQSDRLLEHRSLEQRSADQAWFMRLLDHARLEISEEVRRLTTRALLDHADMMSRLGLLTAQLIAARDVAETAAILEAHLPALGIDHILVALHEAEEDDPVSRSRVVLAVGLPEGTADLRFVTRRFPPPEAYPSGDGLQLVILPLHVDEEWSGFVALPASAIEPAAAIVSNLGMAIRASRLYREAVAGRLAAEDANRMKSRFLSMVSHELRTPLSVVVGLSEMVLEQSRRSLTLPPGTLQDLEHLSTSAQHLGQLVGDVLDLASSEAGQLRLVRQPVSIAEILREVAVVGQQMAHEKGLAWRDAIPATVPVMMGDRTRLRQVALNLVANAVKFTERGGVELSLNVAEDRLVVTVSDTGPGISADERERVFDEFYRSERLSGATHGLGLGLAIARQLVQHHGGRIGVESAGGKSGGATFWFDLPILNASREPSLPAGAPPSILVLTDRATADVWLTEQLTGRGLDVRVRQLAPLEDARTHITRERPNAVILDGDLATRRAWELAREFRNEPGFEALPVLAHRIDPELGRDALLEIDYLVKPVEIGELAGALLREVESRQAPRGGRILIVDDDPEARDLHARIVSQAGYVPIVVGSGAEALSVIARTPPDLVLLDLAMPEMDGFELLEAMRATPAGRDIQVVVLTGHSLTEADVDRLNRGVASVLSKGIFTRFETVARIEAALARQHLVGSASQQLVRRATRFIEANYAEAITRDDIADHVAMSPDYLTDCFHREMGITPITYVNRCRIREARRLLEATELPVTEVALRVGYSEVSHFTRNFHRQVGVSPRAYRRGALGAGSAPARAAAPGINQKDSRLRTRLMGTPSRE
jgi:signal transduction histidine kinase/DNA-binding LacI/PurR family transcriptional regulator/DNA-binding response OmpR family regulator